MRNISFANPALVPQSQVIDAQQRLFNDRRKVDFDKKLSDLRKQLDLAINQTQF